VEALERIGARLVSRGGPDYPPLLAHIEDAPPLIGLLGHAHLLAKKAVAVVGARNASINGCRFARKIAADLGHGGLLVVSGMARDIDAAAHEGTIATGTLAMLGGELLGQVSGTPGATPAGAAGEPVVYVVQPGDTLWEIARRLSPPGRDLRYIVDRLAADSGGPLLQPGQRIILPVDL